MSISPSPLRPGHLADSSSDLEPTVLGLDNIALDLPIAGLGTRSLAMLVDGLVLAILATIWGILWVVVLGAQELGSRLFEESWMMALFLLGYFLLQWGYFFSFEAFFNGRTPGKMALSLQTVSPLGGRPSISAILIRNLLRPIDLAVGVFVMAFDHQSRRLGDWVASTLVVHREPQSHRRRERRLGRWADGWTPSQVALIEGLVGRVERLEPEVARTLASRLLAWMEREHGDFVAQAPAPPDSVEAAGDPVLRLWAVLAVQETSEPADSFEGEPPPAVGGADGAGASPV